MFFFQNLSYAIWTVMGNSREPARSRESREGRARAIAAAAIRVVVSVGREPGRTADGCCAMKLCHILTYTREVHEW